ncbi:hypothetical protein LIER_20375 [Lithospermum erythrorhizon]|uniref:Uncharacterized protein n=1 Tax=Lithospermum erythrorhizon TaxID=34254 RepID=A0AAV3QMB9_LITER
MVTDSQFYNLPESFDVFTFVNEAPTPTPEPSTNIEYALEIEDTYLSMDLRNDVFPLSLDVGTQVESLDVSPDIECLDDHESDSALKFVNQILMEESMDEKASMFHDA